MKKGLLITNGFMQSAKFTALYDALISSAAAHGLTLVERTNTELMPLITKSTPYPGFGIFWDKDVRLGYALTAGGMQLFNTARAIELCDDKSLTHLMLMDKLPMPETMMVPFSFPGVGYLDFTFLDRAEDMIGYPMIIKECFGSFGLQVYLALNRQEAETILTRIRGVPALMQRFVSESRGCDIRVYVVGGKAVAAIRRESSTGGFIANVAAGGTATPYTLSPEQEHIAITAARLLELDFCGVDLLFGKHSPLLIEVNSNAHFAGISAATGVDVAGEIISHVLNKIKDKL
ncbi:MAG: RimK family alpha-L-glutamate ligase [Clostridia bacterium]